MLPEKMRVTQSRHPWGRLLSMLLILASVVWTVDAQTGVGMALTP